jgi:hypothetical protein
MTPAPRHIPLKEKYLDMDGNPVSGRVTLDGYNSTILFRRE